MADLILVPLFSKSGKSFLFCSCTSDAIVISRKSQWGKSFKNTQKPSSPGIQRFLIYLSNQKIRQIAFNFKSMFMCPNSVQTTIILALKLSLL